MLLINLAVHSTANQKSVMEANAQCDSGNQYERIPAIKALIEYFYKYEELARYVIIHSIPEMTFFIQFNCKFIVIYLKYFLLHYDRFVEQNTDDILNKPEKCDKNKYKSQEEVEETVSKRKFNYILYQFMKIYTFIHLYYYQIDFTVIQKAGNHMEHTFLASYVCLLIGHLILDSNDNEIKIRSFLRDQKFTEMVQILEKYYNFLNLTASVSISALKSIAVQFCKSQTFYNYFFIFL